MTIQSFSDFKEGEWQGKALIHDKKNSKRGIVNLVVKAINDEKIRVDVTSPIGTHVASLLISKNEVEYMNIAEKTVVRTKPNREALKQLLKLPLEPEALYAILFDKPMANKNWTCLRDEKQVIKQCQELRSGVSINWNNREGDKRTVDIDHSQASVQMNLFNFKSKVEDPDKSFKLKIPSSFQVKKM